MNTKRFVSETELKQEVLKRVDGGASYRQLAKETFHVSGKKTHVSPAKITRWKKQSQGETTPVGDDEFHGTGTSDGQIASTAFKLFEGGASLAQVVIQMKQAPDLISSLHYKWAELSSGRLVLSTDARRLIENCMGYGIDGQEALDLVIERLADDYLRHMSCPSQLEERRRIRKLVERVIAAQS